MPRLANARGIGKHRNYNVAELATATGTSRGTVRNWIKLGLPLVDGKKPFLIRGRDAIAFLNDRNASRKQPLKSGEFYCLACQKPRRPAGAMADYIPTSDQTGRLEALCEVCDAVMTRIVSQKQSERFRSDLEVTERVLPTTVPASPDPKTGCRNKRRVTTLKGVSNPCPNDHLRGVKSGS